MNKYLASYEQVIEKLMNYLNLLNASPKSIDLQLPFKSEKPRNLSTLQLVQPGRLVWLEVGADIAGASTNQRLRFHISDKGYLMEERFNPQTTAKV